MEMFQDKMLCVHLNTSDIDDLLCATSSNDINELSYSDSYYRP